jgi:drug/metabolite transporter (DMT)-like permease
MITRPGADAFEWSALLPIGAAALYAFTAVTARLVDDDVPTPLFNLYSSATAAVGAIVLALLFGGFSQIDSLRDLGLIALMGAFGGSAVLCLVVSFRMTEPSNLAPFTYFGIPIAFAFGWLFFTEAPIDDLFPGALLLVGGGLLIIYRERRVSRAANRASINPGYQSIDTEFPHTEAAPQFDKSRKV